MTKDVQRSIVFVTGAFLGNNCWDQWMTFFENEGYLCIAPPWPHKDAPPEELRNRPANDPLALNTIRFLTDYFAAIVSALPEKPILIGHSAGGLIVQSLLQRDLGVAGVAIHSFAPSGVNTFRLSCIKMIWEMSMLFTSGQETFLISFRKWKYMITNGMICARQKQLYYQYAIPESKRVIRQTFRSLTKIDFKRPHVPLLLTSGTKDKFIPCSLNYKNYRRYTAAHSFADYKEFKEHTHLVFGNPSWKREADFILYWLRGINN